MREYCYFYETKQPLRSRLRVLLFYLDYKGYSCFPNAPASGVEQATVCLLFATMHLVENPSTLQIGSVKISMMCMFVSFLRYYGAKKENILVHYSRDR